MGAADSSSGFDSHSDGSPTASKVEFGCVLRRWKTNPEDVDVITSSAELTCSPDHFNLYVWERLCMSQ